MYVPQLPWSWRVRAKFNGYLAGFRALSRAIDYPLLLALRSHLGSPPWKVRFREGTEITAISRSDLFEKVHRHIWDPSLSTTVTYTLHGGELSTVRLITLGQSTGSEVYLDQIYRALPVRGRVVIDVGTNIGDSAIYFALRGAERVIALEPDPQLLETARRNLELNTVRNVELIRASIGGLPSNIDPRVLSHMHQVPFSNPDSVETGPAPVESLEHLADLAGGRSISLKMDCEGAEYEAILSTTAETLRRFVHIQLEYHYGPAVLQRHLEACGFEVECSPPRPSLDLRSGMCMAAGQLLAKHPGVQVHDIEA